MSRRTELIRSSLTALTLSVPFAICHPSWVAIDVPIVRSLAINAVLFIVPGLSWLGLARRDARAPWPLLWAIAGSLLVFAAGVLFTFLTGRTLTAGAVWNFAWAITILGCLASGLNGGWTPGTLISNNSRTRAAVAIFALAYALFFYGASRIVPPQGDHDLDLQGTAYALLTRLTPSYNTPRGSNYLAHPPLLHAYVAGSFLYFNKLDELRIYDAATTPLELGKEWQHYLQHPFLLETRTPNIFLGALTVAVMFFWLSGGLGASLAIVIAMAYATLPEAFVRFSYGGYFAISQFSILLMAIAVSELSGDHRSQDRVSWWSAALAAGFAAWANHKLVFVPFSVGLWCLLSSESRIRWRWALTHPVVCGFLVGTTAFWLYGFWVSPGDFLNDHLRTHIVDRAVATAQPGSEYLGAGALWLEFLRDTSYLLVPAGLAALALSFDGFLIVWAVSAGLAFTLVDWKMTKHLAEIFLLAPLIAFASATTRRHIPYLVALILGAVTLVLNVSALVRLRSDFASLIKLPEW